MTVKEKEIECYFCTQITNLNGIPFKFVSPGNAGVPDRLVVLPKGLVIFVELKAPGRKTRALQDRQIARLEGLGHWVEILDSFEAVDDFITRVKEEM